MKYQTVLFDMDGTLLDTLTDMETAVNHILTQYGYPTRTLEEVRRFVGNGAGLGLSLVWEIAELHGGSVWVEESSEKGTTIAVGLPVQ